MYQNPSRDILGTKRQVQQMMNPRKYFLSLKEINSPQYIIWQLQNTVAINPIWLTDYYKWLTDTKLLLLLCRGKGSLHLAHCAMHCAMHTVQCTVSHSNLTTTWQCFSICRPWLASVFLLSAFIFSSLLPALGLRPRPRMLDQDYGWIHLVHIASFQGEIWGQRCNASLTVIVTRTSQTAVLISDFERWYLYWAMRRG